jgi:predicted DNA-binding transcriptional regulator YafY
MGTMVQLSSSSEQHRTLPGPATERVEGAWRVYPMEGALELHYCDQFGNSSTRRIIARELKVGPGKTLLGGIDMADDGYRGFRADRIHTIVDAETGLVIDRNILDWLIKRAESQAKERRKAEKSARAA